MSNSIQEILKKRPLIITGPCSAETEEQVLETAQELARLQVGDIFRAGIWKPRTRPGSFEGIGTRGLPWLQKARELYGMPYMVEVANTKQVEDSLHFDVNAIWIGARSTVNPISMQEIANSLRGVDIPVFIKNPINPDLELWTGALERIAQAGIKTIGLIHRGFSVFGNTEYRYAPMWHLAIEMRRRNPELAMICDPAHISGRRDIIQAVAQKSVDLDYDGLMIESHINPDCAWTDKKQQVTPQQLKNILDTIIWRKELSDEATFNSALEQLREQINHIDDELLDLLGKRMQIADKIGQYKKDNNITILQTARWNEIIDRETKKGGNLGLSPAFIKSYLEAVHMESINHQNKVMDQK
ncbi:MAG: bifunctional 3-deoxy-7-phosphoheptulonate synthase/chorismate mutase type II [Ignavibacteriales bacterium]|nr:bifunctional 3-deoxy-7-phosphoheptulonate synthase/chorismate mutase type II [Ignavibacteriales bacterium]